MPPLSLMIKPVSGLCNMHCRYCFYIDETKHRETPLYGTMESDTLDLLVRRVLAEAESSCTFGFQGGEPTLAGLDFFRRLIELEKRYNKKGLRISHALQTNGLTIDDAWARFLRENNFLVGLSLDGPKDIHDANRLDTSDKGTFTRVMRTVALFQKYGVEFNILAVVTNRSARHGRQIYDFFLKHGLTYQQYIACLDPLGEERGSHPHSLKPEAYGNFLITLFDLWYRDRSNGKFVYIRDFENLGNMVMGGEPERCGMSGRCVNQHIVEANGDVFPCDFYMLDDYRLGNLKTDDLAALDAGCAKCGFIKESAALPEECKACRWLPICRGGCRRDRQTAQLHQVGSNYFCAAFRKFYEHAFPKLLALRARLSFNNHAGDPR